MRIINAYNKMERRSPLVNAADYVGNSVKIFDAPNVAKCSLVEFNFVRIYMDVRTIHLDILR